MKIAMIGQKGIPVSAGGVERHVEEIGKRLVQRGHNVTVYNRLGYSETESSKYYGIDLKETYTIHNKALEPVIYSFLASIDSIFRNYDIVHYHALGPASMSFIPRLSSKKIVVTVHGLDWQREKWGAFAKLYLKLGEKACVYFPHKTITVSSKLKTYFENKYNKTVYYIPNGVNRPEIYPVSIISEKFGLDKNSYILFLARIVPEKGCHYLVEAFKQIKTNVKLVIAGGSSYTDKYYSELQKNASDNVIFTGEVRGKMLNELYSNALFFVLPSEIEGLSLSLLEAMSYGLCPLVSDIEENIEAICSDNRCYGYSFTSGNADSLKVILVYMLDNMEEVAKKGELAREYILKKYSWDNVTDELEELYKSILTGC